MKIKFTRKVQYTIKTELFYLWELLQNLLPIQTRIQFKKQKNIVFLVHIYIYNKNQHFDDSDLIIKIKVNLTWEQGSLEEY